MKRLILLSFCSLFAVVGISILPTYAQLSGNSTLQAVGQPRGTILQAYVDTAVDSLVENRPEIRDKVEIMEARVSSDGLYAMVSWTYNPAGGMTIMRKVDGEIQILAEGGGVLRQSDIERMGIPPEAAAEITSDWGRNQ